MIICVSCVPDGKMNGITQASVSRGRCTRPNSPTQLNCGIHGLSRNFSCVSTRMCKDRCYVARHGRMIHATESKDCTSPYPLTPAVMASTWTSVTETRQQRSVSQSCAKSIY